MFERTSVVSCHMISDTCPILRMSTDNTIKGGGSMGAIGAVVPFQHAQLPRYRILRWINTYFVLRSCHYCAIGVATATRSVVAPQKYNNTSYRVE